MTYMNNEEFITDVESCVLHLNSLEDEGNRIPVDLVVAQAIHESDYGTSYFAEKANNLMGIKEFDETELSLKPRNNPDADWGLKIFETKCESISYYMDLLNHSHHYSMFREERIKQYISDLVDVEALAGTLAIYAEDVYYTQKIIKAIRELNDYK